MAREGKKVLHIELPEELWQLLARVCIDYGITKTEAVSQYIRYLKAQKAKERRLLNEGSTEEFKLTRRIAE